MAATTVAVNVIMVNKKGWLLSAFYRGIFPIILSDVIASFI